MLRGPYRATMVAQRSQRSTTVNIHPILLTELVRQRQLHMLDEAKHWSSRVKLRRRAHRSGAAA
jgi:hypothetical protein